MTGPRGCRLAPGRGAAVERVARNRSVELVYEHLGRAEAEPLLLVMGAAFSMMLWPAGFLDALLAKGFQLIRFDNRDSGLSTHLSDLQPPSTLKALRALRAKGRNARRLEVPYTLDDMADDTVAVLDAAGWDSAHVVGISLGAAIAQMVCVRHPGRVRTLVSISSSPPDFAMARPSLKGIRVLARSSRRTRGIDAAAEAAVKMARIIGSPAYPTDDAEIRRAARVEYERAHDRQGGRRQGIALMASENRLERLRSVTIPTLIIHGENDVLAPPVGSKLIAAAIQGAHLVMVPGMGHDLPQGLWTRLADEIAHLAFMWRG